MPSLATTKLQHLNPRLAGRIVAPGDYNWDQVRQAFNLLVDQRPAAVALPADADDVSLIVSLAREHGLRIAPQTTGHNAGPLGDLENTLLVKTSAMTEVLIDPALRLARVGAGARWQDVVQRASELGLAALHCSSRDVGIAGYSLGGGMGWYARKRGLQTNRVTAIELVTADGRQLRASADSEPNLFWALRGGGGNFGVVTVLEFELYPISEVYAGVLFFPWERSAEVLHAWHEWLPGTPDEVTSLGRLMQFPPLDLVPEVVRGKSFVIVEAAYLGSEADGADLIAPLRDLGPAMDTFAMLPPVGLSDLHMDPESPIPGISDHNLVGELPAAAIDELMAVVGPGSGSPLASVELRQTGGALGRTEPSHGALASLPGKYAMFAGGAPMDEPDAAAITPQLSALADVLAPYDAGRYLNFVETPYDTAEAFQAATYRRLQAVKEAYDPDGAMQANHPIA